MTKLTKRERLVLAKLAERGVELQSASDAELREAFKDVAGPGLCFRAAKKLQAEGRE